MAASIGAGGQGQSTWILAERQAALMFLTSEAHKYHPEEPLIMPNQIRAGVGAPFLVARTTLGTGAEKKLDLAALIADHWKSISSLSKKLTEADMQTIQANWSKIFSNAEENGRLILIRFFTDYPESKKYFRTVLTEGDLRRNRELSFLGKRVMISLDTMINSMSNWSRVSTHIGRLVENHRDRHGVPVDMFQFLLQSALNVFKDLLGEELFRTAWQKFIEALLEEIRAAYISDLKS